MKNLYIFAPDKNQLIMHFLNDPAIWLKEVFINAGLGYGLSSFLSFAGLVVIVVFLGWFSNLVVKTIILEIVTRIVKRTTSTWDDIFLEQKVFTRLSHFAPAIVIWSMAGWALKAYPGWMMAIQNLTYIYMVLIGMVVVNLFIESWHKIYLLHPISKHRTIKGYVQILKLVVIVIALLIIISVVFGRKVGTIIAGLGALAAVVSLIFKDVILGLVASIQLSANNMLKVGDWITIPSRGVDGVTEDITLTTVKVRNFDKTILTVPVYSLVSESFQNWKGMEEAGVRQLKRVIFIDMRSIKFPDRELIEKLVIIPYIKEYFDKKKEENEKSPDRNDESRFLKTAELTNLGLFRLYAESYLKNHPMIENKEALIVRHREPEGNGLPLQVYAFCRNINLIPFENLQSEIIEHLLAVLSEFELKVFQNPTGDDIKTISGTN
jgi:miniconductance mechanosensitive channel